MISFFIFISGKEIYYALKNKKISPYLLVKIIYILAFWLALSNNLFNENFTNYIISIPAVISILTLYLKDNDEYDSKEIINLTINIVSFSLFLFLSLKSDWHDEIQFLLGLFLSYNIVKYFYIVFELKIHKSLYWAYSKSNKLFKNKVSFIKINNPYKIKETSISYKFKSYINDEYIVEASAYLHNQSCTITHIGMSKTLELACINAKNNLLNIYKENLII